MTTRSSTSFDRSAKAGLAATVSCLVVSCSSSARAPQIEARAQTNGRESADRALYVGTYTAPGIPPDGNHPSTARGIYVFRMRGTDGHLTPVQTVETENPSYLALDPSGAHLYCTNENEALKGTPAGAVTAFDVNRADGTLKLLNAQKTNGNAPAHLSVHPSGRYLTASNYDDGDYPVYRLLPDGSIGPQTDDARGSGTGPVADRQEGPHAHQIQTDPDGRRVFGVDLGADVIRTWDLDLASGKLTPGSPASFSLPPGSGPRHMAFHPNRSFAYVLNELAGTIAIFHYDPVRGSLTPSQTVSSFPAGFAGSKSTAEIRIHPNGRFLYASNRGNNTVGAFTIDARTGALEPIGWEPTQGDGPRGMNIDPEGRFLYVANQNSDSIVVFRIDPQSGKLMPTGEKFQTPTPVDLEFGAELPRRFAREHALARDSGRLSLLHSGPR
jgi:6-phosphogluconolactonase